MNSINKDQLYDLAKKRVIAKKIFTIHFLLYIIISVFLASISLYYNKIWFIYPLFGWGMGIFVHIIVLNAYLNLTNNINKEFENLKGYMKND